ncbi:chloride channel protein [Williamsia maris]|uniref:Chloride channel protein, CIC family n=1 Tax=Williamsia maris TaxID=72806 RepID=A0ABT1HDR2_9NOCA|nr:chloride channel protein [Williamsia maris]MCP2176072.1 chloride channel protein, CIC family [Williamsia maris]
MTALPMSPTRWIRTSRTALVPLAVAIGLGTGLGAVAFRWLITSITWLFTGTDDFSDAGRVGSSHFPGLGIWFLLVAPMIAGAIYGPLVYRFAPEAKGHGVPEVMYAVAQRGGRIAPRVALVKALASALCIGGGGSVGREGPIVQIGSALGSTLGQWTRVDAGRLKVLVACGAAGGISATFNAPLAGPFFALELILRDFAAESFGAVVLSSVTASLLARAIIGDDPFLSLPVFTVHNPAEYALYLVLGVVVGTVGVLFSKVLYLVEDICDWAWRWPDWARPAVGGLLLGAVLLAVPQMYGVGYPILQNAVEGKYVIGFLLLLLVAKMIATSLTIGIGGSGGVFAPTLFIGAMAGSAFGAIGHDLAPGIVVSAGAYGLIAMGAALGGATRAPITAVIILFELTGEYSIILPLMLAVAMAAGTSQLISKDTIYTRKLLRRGIDIDKPVEPDPFGGQTVGRAVGPAPEPMAGDTELSAATGLLAESQWPMLPVVDPTSGRYRGCVSARGVAEALQVPAAHSISVDQIAELPAALTVLSTVDEALEAMADHAGTGVPVLDDDHERVVGWITHRDLLTTLRQGESA